MSNLVIRIKSGVTSRTKETIHLDPTGKYIVDPVTGHRRAIVDPPITTEPAYSNTTALPGDVTSGAIFVDSGGTLVSGTLPVVAQPAPTVSVTAAGLVSAGYIPLAGRVVDTTAKSATLQLPAVGASTYIPGTADQVISGGVYLAGDQTIAGDTNLVASNIRSGVSIFGVSGSIADGGGTTPTYISGAVIADAGEWHKGVFGSLPYHSGHYSIKYCDGTFFHTGDLTVCGWMCRTSAALDAVVIFGSSYGIGGNANWISLQSNGLGWGNGGDPETGQYQGAMVSQSIPVDEWHHFIMEYNATTSKCSITLDNRMTAVQADTKTMAYIDTGMDPLCLNAVPWSLMFHTNFAGRYSHVMVFSRLLTAEEKTALAGEFTPTA